MKVSDRSKVFAAAYSVLWLLLLVGVGGLVVIVPALAAELVGRYSEYRGEFVVVLILIGIPVLLGMSILGLVIALLEKIRTGSMLNQQSYGLIRALIVSTATLAGSFVLIGVWLSLKNTLPPIILIILVLLTLISLAVSLVASILFSLLRQAVDDTQELSEVI